MIRHVCLCCTVVGMVVSGCSRSYHISPFVIEPPPPTAISILPKDGLTAMSLSPDGELLAVGTIDGVSVYQTDTQERLWPPPSQKGLQGLSVGCMAFSPDGSKLFTGHDGFVTVWNTMTGDALSRIDGFNYSVTSLAVHPKQQLLSVGMSWGPLIVWNMEANRMVFHAADRIVGDMSIPRTVSVWSPDGTMLAVGGWEPNTQIWSPSGELLETVNIDSVDGNIVWSPDGDFVAANSVESVFVWSIRAGKQEVALHQEIALGQLTSGGRVTGLSWSPDGKWIALGSWDGRISVWNMETYELTYTLRGHTQGVHSLQWTPDSSKLFSASYDNTVVIWDIEQGEPIDCLWCESQD